MNPDLLQDPQAGRMQPLARQPDGPVGGCFEQRHSGALLGVGKRADAADRASADDGDVVVLRMGHNDSHFPSLMHAGCCDRS